MSELHYHESLLGALESIATLDEMVGPVELVCLWFDDLYFPGQTRSADYPVETWERGQCEWRECFPENELSILAAFHTVYRSVADTLSEDPLTFKHDKNWVKVAEAAKAALSQLGCGIQHGAPADGSRTAHSDRG